VSHLAECDKCTRLTEEPRILHRVLSHWPGRPLPDEIAVTRLRSFVEEMTGDVAKEADYPGSPPGSKPGSSV
jgi:hypothetical protein